MAWVNIVPESSWTMVDAPPMPDMGKWSTLIATSMRSVDKPFVCSNAMGIRYDADDDRSLLTHDALEVFAEMSVALLRVSGGNDDETRDAIRVLKALHCGLRHSSLAGNHPAKFDDFNAWFFAQKTGLGEDPTDGANVREQVACAATLVAGICSSK
jgi:hypothetical protein